MLAHVSKFEGLFRSTIDLKFTILAQGAYWATSMPVIDAYLLNWPVLSSSEVKIPTSFNFFFLKIWFIFSWGSCISLSLLFKTSISNFFCFTGLGRIEQFLCKQENSQNPFLDDSTPETSLLDLAVDILTTVTSKRNSRKYRATVCGWNMNLGLKYSLIAWSFPAVGNRTS